MFGYFYDLKTAFKLSLFAAFMFSSGCMTQSSSLIYSDKAYIHPDLVEYVERFEEYGEKYMYEGFTVGHMSIDIGHTRNVKGEFGGPAVGWCKKAKRQIMISETDWYSYSDSMKEQLMFHELGHCVLLREHRKDKDPWGQPNSMMYPKMVRRVWYETYREYYIDELFNGYHTTRVKK